MAPGDLVIVTKELPDWHWLDYTTGHIGIITSIRHSTKTSQILGVFILNTQKVCVIPSYFVKLLGEGT